MNRFFVNCQYSLGIFPIIRRFSIGRISYFYPSLKTLAVFLYLVRKETKNYETLESVSSPESGRKILCKSNGLCLTLRSPSQGYKYSKKVG